MCSLTQLNYRYVEWSYNSHSDKAGHLILTEFYHRSRQLCVPIHCSVYRYDSESKCYCAEREVDDHYTIEAASTLLKRCILSNSICILRIAKNELMSQLLSSYILQEVGHLYSNQQNEVFPAPLEWNLEKALPKSDLYLVVHHDADNLFVLNTED